MPLGWRSSCNNLWRSPVLPARTAELFPAIAEAYYQRVPLVVLTADRPKEWVDQGDGQTIVQENAFGTHVLSAVQLNTIHTDQHRWLFERQCAETIHWRTASAKGPVHLNIPFNEPLYGTTKNPRQSGSGSAGGR